METITNAANAASKAVFGDSSSGQSGQEPVSGQTGRGTASEPYDGGNTMGNVSQSITAAFCDSSSVIALIDCTVPVCEARTSTSSRKLFRSLIHVWPSFWTNLRGIFHRTTTCVPRLNMISFSFSNSLHPGALADVRSW